MKSCEFCTKKFRGATKLKHHMWRSHLGYKASSFLVCLICNLVFPQKTSLKNHVRRKHMNLPHGTCSVCGEDIASKNAWKRHKKNHDGGAKIITQKILTHEIAGNLELENQRLIEMMSEEGIQEECCDTVEKNLEKYCDLKMQTEDLRATDTDPRNKNRRFSIPPPQATWSKIPPSPWFPQN